MTKSLIALAGLLIALTCGAARADVTYDFARVACVPEAGMFDVEYRGVHDTVAGYIYNGNMGKAEALRRHGFYLARGLDVSCRLGEVVYRVTATQDPQVEKICGASPEVYLTVTRNGEPMLRDVVFGISCNGFPSVLRISFGDGPAITGDAEASICYMSSDSSTNKSACDWIFSGSGGFKKAFPIDQNAVTQRVGRLRELNML